MEEPIEPQEEAPDLEMATPKRKTPRKIIDPSFIDGLYACDLCDYKGARKKYLTRHINNLHTDPTVKCKYCPKLFSTKSHMMKHVLVHTGERPFKCLECGKDFNRQYTLKNHSYIHADIKPFTCDTCPFACRDSSTLRKHKQDKHLPKSETRRYRCSVCSKSIKSKRDLKVHVAERHLNIDVKIFQCTKCDTRFKEKSALNAHIKSVHERLMTTKCPICDKTLANVYNLPGHLKVVHTDKRPYKCMEKGCDKCYKDMCGLKKHSILHFPEKHFPCAKCGRTFSRYHRMLDHMSRMHAGPPRKRKTNHLHLECDYCGFVAKSRPGMANHIKGLHESGMKRCKICRKQFKYYFLVRHYRMIHGIKYKRPLKKSRPSVSAEEKVKSELSDRIQVDIKQELLDDVTSIDLFEIEKEEDLQDLFYESEPQSDDETMDNTEAEQVIDNIEQAIDDTEAAKRIRDSEISVHISDVAEVLDQLCDTGFSEDPLNTSEKIEKNIQNGTQDRDDDVSKEITHPRKEVIEKNIENGTQNLDEENATIEVTDPQNIGMSEETENETKYLDEENATKEIELDETEKIKLNTEDENSVQNVSPKVETEHNLNEPKIVYRFRARIQNKQSKTKRVYKNTEDRIRGPNFENLSQEMAKTLIEKNVNNMRTIPDAIFDAFFIQTPEKKVKERITTTKKMFHDSDNRCNSDNDIAFNSAQLKLIQSLTTRKIIKTTKTKTVNRDTSKPRSYVKNRQPMVNYSLPKKEFVIDESVSSIYNTRKRRYNYKDEFNKYGNSNLNYDAANSDCDDKLFKHELESEDEEVAKKRAKKERRAKRKKLKEEMVTEEKIEQLIEGSKRRKKRKQRITEEKKGVLSNHHQCYVCFKMFDSKENLIDHCKEHYDICNEINLKKCPLCDFVSRGIYLSKHMILVHKVDIYNKANAMKVKDRKDTSKGSRYYIEVKNDEVIKEIDVIPSIKNLNRLAYMNLDKKRREEKDKMIGKEKLVKKKEWVVEVEKLDVENVFVPKIDVDLPGDKYMEKIRKLYYIAKKEGKSMMFPCQNCDKICQTFSALKLHKRRHDPDKKPFKKKVWKHKIKKLLEEEAKRQNNGDDPENSAENPTTRENVDREIQETCDKITDDKEKQGLSDTTTSEKKVSDKKNKAKKDKSKSRNKKPAPIVNNHKCSPELMSFYKDFIRGENIEFWQFLKIYNKMGRENIKDFVDLETRENNDFGVHVPVATNLDKASKDDEKSTENDDDPSTSDDQSSKSVEKLSITTKKCTKSTKKGSKNVTSNTIADSTLDGRKNTKGKRKLDKSRHSRITDKCSKNVDISKTMSSTKSVRKPNFNRTVKITKKEYLKRETIKAMLREKYKDKSLLMNTLQQKYVLTQSCP